MPSPFPGMNPYLEEPIEWPDFHNSFLIHAKEQLAAQLGPEYVIRVEARILVREFSAA